MDDRLGAADPRGVFQTADHPAVDGVVLTDLYVAVSVCQLGVALRKYESRLPGVLLDLKGEFFPFGVAKLQDVVVGRDPVKGVVDAVESGFGYQSHGLDVADRRSQNAVVGGDNHFSFIPSLIISSNES